MNTPLVKALYQLRNKLITGKVYQYHILEPFFTPGGFFPDLSNNYAMVKGSVDQRTKDLGEKERYYALNYRDTYLRNHKV